MGPAYTLEEGTWAVSSARAAVEAWVRSSKRFVPDARGRLGEARGVFVTLESYPSMNLRGCIGFPLPHYPLPEAISRAAASAATEDPRFPPVSADELLRIVVEVSLLTVPEEVRVSKPEEYASKIKVGRDGLIASYQGRQGLLLPQVPVELNWDEAKFIEQTCWKAGLPTDSWRRPGFSLSSFHAHVFCEDSPKGKIREKKLGT